MKSTPIFWKCLVCCLGLLLAGPADSSTAWPGPTGPFVFVEAESFQPQGTGWNAVTNKPNMFRPVSESGLQSLSGAAKGDGTAVRTVEVPTNATYRLWVRYAQWPKTEEQFRAPFRVTVSQNGREVFQHVYDESLVGEPGDRRRTTADLVWVPADVTLEKGPAEIRLSKVGKDRVLPNLRQVDCLLLTSDRDYTANHRDFGPQMYVRIRLHGVKPERVYFYVFLNHSRTPWYTNLHFDKTGCSPGVNAAEKNRMTAGDATPWAPFSRFLYDGLDVGISFHATIQYGQRFAETSDYSVDFATAPDEASIVKTIRRNGPGDGLQMVVPPDLEGEHRPRSDREFAGETAAFTAKLAAVPFGRTPRRFPVMLGLNADDHNNTPGTRELENRSLTYMGINGVGRRLGDQDIRDGLRFGVEHASIWHMGRGQFSEPNLEKIEASLKSRAESLVAEGHADRIIANLLMDEAGALPLETLAGSEVIQQDFRHWLREQKHQPKDFGVDAWEAVKLATSRDDQPPLRYLRSQQFRAWNIVNFFRQVTELSRKYYPPSVRTTQNYSDGAVYLANFFMQGNDYFTWFKSRALDLAWSEDWTNGGSTPQTCGWNVALLRAATKYHGQPIGMYDITSYGRKPMVVKLKAYSDIAQGAKSLYFYSYTPRYQSHERGWYQRWEMYPAVAEVCHEIGAAEEVLMDAMPRKAQTAILYSVPYDIWNVGFDNSQGMERMHTYLALRHGQVPVDVLSNEDVRDGYLRDYKVAYLFGEQLDRRDVTPLADWVKRGGTLMLSPGAASKDELNQPSDALDKALGLERKPLETLQKFHGPGNQIGQVLKPQGKVSLLGDDGKQVATVDLLACRQQFGETREARVLARFDDGQPAAVEVARGRGRVLLVGFMPALAYIHEAWNKASVAEKREELVEPLAAVAQALALSGEHPEKPVRVKRQDHFPVPFEYPAALRDFILAPGRLARVERPVETETPQVEATFMEGETGWVVPLANYTGEPLKSLKLTIRPGRASEAIYSARAGLLVENPRRGKEITVTIPLESTDFVFAKWKKMSGRLK